MPQNKSYDDHNAQDSPITEFFIWLFIIGMATPLSYGWVLVNAGLISNTTLFASCGGLGVFVGLKAMVGTARNRKARARKATALPADLEAGKDRQQDHPLQNYRLAEKLPTVLHPADLDCEACQKPSNAQYSDSNNAFAQVHLVVDRRIERRGSLHYDGDRDGDDGGGLQSHHHRRP